MGCEFYRRETPIARKSHKCALCGEEIIPGERYVHLVCLATGYDIYDGKLHESCAEVQDRFVRENQDEEFSDDWVREDILDRVCNGCPDDEDCDLSWREITRCRRVIDTYLVKAPKEKEE